VQETVHEAVDGLSAAQLAARLDDDANSIAWLCWHLARVQDDHVADAFGVEQVWPRFVERFGLPFGPGATGYGHTSRQVAVVRVSGDLLTDYQDAARPPAKNGRWPSCSMITIRCSGSAGPRS